MDYSAIGKLYLVAIKATLVGLDRQRRVVLPVLPVGFNNVLINVDYCFHTNLKSRHTKTLQAHYTGRDLSSLHSTDIIILLYEFRSSTFCLKLKSKIFGALLANFLWILVAIPTSTPTCII
jgi:hypothetical protein